MKSNTASKLIFAVTFLISAISIAQNHEHTEVPCLSSEYEKHYRVAENETKREAFERWLAPKVAEYKKSVSYAKRMDNTNDEVVTLPVVVHIIHDGDEVGESENIPDERIFSQIEVLNQDYRRMEGTPGYVEGTPGVDTGIQFCLAQQDPDGNPTTGIDRQNLGVASWNSFETIDNNLKPATMWDPSRYINIWVCRFGGQLSQVGGYSYFPEGSGLEGLEGAESTATIDGIMMSFKAFGSSDIFPANTYFPQNDKGRSLVHEMGHFFGLRHIWGDETSCSATDYCDDTPPVAGVHFECTHVDTCPDDEFEDMIENHMDYTPDVCKSVFTNDQKTRMWVVLQNAVRRTSLLTSNACEPPVLGLNGATWDKSLKLYPNPASDALYITANDLFTDASYTVYNTLGVAVKSGTISNGSYIDVASFSNGVYIVKISKDGLSKTLRFVKQ